jgi:hypothetical protein
MVSQTINALYAYHKAAQRAATLHPSEHAALTGKSPPLPGLRQLTHVLLAEFSLQAQDSLIAPRMRAQASRTCVR